MSGLEYVILKVDAEIVSGRRGRRRRPVDADDLLGSALSSEERLLPKREGVSVETATLTEREVADGKRDTKHLFALNMPVELVRPVSVEAAGLKLEGDPLENARAAKISWGIRAIGADASEFTGKGVRVAVLDTGIEPSHPAFQGVELTRKNFTANDDDDHQGHGTHCAGTIFGQDVDGVRIGVARGVESALIGKVLDNEGRGTTAAVLEGLKWAHSNGANIVSMSLGFDFTKMQEKLVERDWPARLATSMALKAFRENLRSFETLVAFLLQESDQGPGMVIVAASGNESDREADPDYVIDVSIPASASRDMVSVGAVMRVGEKLAVAPFSNINPVLCAPGVGIVSAALGGGLRADNGTSMACPHVAGAAALWWEWASNSIGSAIGTSVRGKLIGSASLDSFLPEVENRDRGNGFVMAPRG